MLWSELLDVPPRSEMERLLRVRDEKTQPFVAMVKLDVRLLTELGPTTPIKEHAPDYPWLFTSQAVRGMSFIGVGTNNQQIALQMVLWQTAADVYNSCAVHSPETQEYKTRLAKAFMLGTLATKTCPPSVTPE